MNLPILRPTTHPGMTRKEWYTSHQYCRVLSKMIEPYMDEVYKQTEEQLIQLMLYGVAHTGRTSENGPSVDPRQY